MLKKVARKSLDRKGSTSVLFGLMALIVFSVTGVAIDYGRAVSAKSHMQAALDSATLATTKTTNTDYKTFLKSAFAANLGTIDANSVDISSWKLASQVWAIAKLDVPTTLSKIMGFDSLPVEVRSTAGLRVVSTPSTGKACVMVLDKDASQAFLVNSGARVVAPDCEIHVHSTRSPAAIFNSNSTIDTARVCIAGTSIIDNGGVHPNVQLGCNVAADPYRNTVPAVTATSCQYSNLNFNGGTVNLSPGVYCGWHNFNNAPTVNFAPGLYIIKNGGWNVNGGNWYGEGVSFYYADQSKIQFNSAVHAELKAPATGTYAGYVMFENPNNSRSQFVLDDSRGFKTEGLIYLPTRDVTFNSASNLEGKKVTLIVNTLILDDTNWNLEPEEHAVTVPSSSTTMVPALGYWSN